MPEEQTTEVVQDPTTTPALTGPWANDLAAQFPDDPALQARVAEFLRTSTQPYLTRLEQEKAQLAPAQELYNDLLENPASAYLAITEELFGEEFAQQLEQRLNEEFSEEEQEPVTETTETEDKQPVLTPEQQAALEFAQKFQQKQSYNDEFARVREANPDITAEEWNLFHPFVATSDGDFDKAVVGFNAWREQAKQQYAPAEETVEETETAPPVVGEQTAQTPPPVEKQYTGPNGLDNALDDFLAETRAGAPPVVGSV